MIHAAFSRRTLALVGAAAMLLAIGCGGGGGGDDPAQGTGSIQVLNNTGMDLADVEIQMDGSTVDEIGGGLVSGGSWTFSDLEPGVYDVLAFPGGGGIQVILFFNDNTVQSGQTTNVTMTP